MDRVVFFLLPSLLYIAMIKALSCPRACDYINAYKQANCQGRSPGRVPVECNDATFLALEENDITTIKPWTFSTFSNLQYVILSNNRIGHIEGNTFSGALQLKSIKLLYNDLQSIDRDAFKGTGRHFKKLYMSRNNIARIEDGTFQQAPHLEFIDLYNNSLTEVTSETFKRLKHLERLFLGHNRIVHLEADVFKDLTALVYLDLSNNSLSHIPSNLFKYLIQLKTIDLSRNQLTTTGGVIHLPVIYRIDLRWNNLTNIGKVTEFKLNEISHLYLESNSWVCNHSLETLRLWYQSSPRDRGISIDSPLCSGPPEFLKSSIRSIDKVLPSITTEEPTTPLITTSVALEKIPEEKNLPFPDPTTNPLNVTTVIVPVICILVLVTIGFFVYIIYRKQMLCFKSRRRESKANEQRSEIESCGDGKDKHTPDKPTILCTKQGDWQHSVPSSLKKRGKYSNKASPRKFASSFREGMHIIENHVHKIITSTPIKERDTQRRGESKTCNKQLSYSPKQTECEKTSNNEQHIEGNSSYDNDSFLKK